MSDDILGTSWDQCRNMVQYCFTSTETRRLVRTDGPGRPPRLSHSSWTMWVHTAPELCKMRNRLQSYRAPVVRHFHWQVRCRSQLWGLTRAQRRRNGVCSWRQRNVVPLHKPPWTVRHPRKLQAAVYDILPAAAVIIGYATGFRRL